MSSLGSNAKKAPSKGWRRHVRRKKALDRREERSRRAINHPVNVAVRHRESLRKGQEEVWPLPTPSLATTSAPKPAMTASARSFDWTCGACGRLNQHYDRQCWGPECRKPAPWLTAQEQTKPDMSATSVEWRCRKEFGDWGMAFPCGTLNTGPRCTKCGALRP